MAACYALYDWCYLPYGCNVFKRRAEVSMLAAANVASPLRLAPIARRNLEQSLQWIRRCPNDLDLYMIAGGSFRQLGLSTEAIPMYQRALTLDRRPEIYLNLGQAQVEAGQIGEAMPNLTSAVLFDPNLITEIPASLQQKVEELARSRV
jgi:tetratricopeptide (TPR) repeat protein